LIKDRTAMPSVARRRAMLMGYIDRVALGLETRRRIPS
jgi:hypothetical protein